MKLLHYSAEPLVLDRKRTYPESGYGLKPTGLWLSVEDDWWMWCEGEDFGSDRLKHASEVTLKPDANVLIIDSILKLDEFDAKFRCCVDDTVHITHKIEWRKVKVLYDGLIIAPYHWPRRYDLIWYYVWDCASGVLWNLLAIANVTVCPNIRR